MTAHCGTLEREQGAIENSPGLLRAQGHGSVWPAGTDPPPHVLSVDVRAEMCPPEIPVLKP